MSDGFSSCVHSSAQCVPGQVPAARAGRGEGVLEGSPEWRGLGQEPAPGADWAVNPWEAGARGRDSRAGKGENRGTSVPSNTSLFCFFYWGIVYITNGIYVKCSIFKVLVYVYTHETIAAIKFMNTAITPSFQSDLFEAIWSCPTDHWISVDFFNFFLSGFHSG